MERKALVAVVLPVTLICLFFGIILASRTFTDDQEMSCGIDDATYYQLIARHLATEMKVAERLEMLGLYVRNHLTIAGRTQLLPFYMPEVRSPKQAPRTQPRTRLRTRGGKQVRLRPASAHAHWRRVRKEGVFVWPVDPTTFWISSYFGPRTIKGCKGFHQGIDMAASHGTPVVAAANGYVKEAQYAPGYGNYILLVHPGSYKTRYAHLSRIRVKKGQRVRAGQLIGNVGATGKVTKSKWGTSADHLHFEVYSKGKRVNPFSFLA